MKKYLAVPVLIIICMSTHAETKDIKAALKEFGLIVGGNALNKKCDFLDEKQTKLFDKNRTKSGQRLNDWLLTENMEINQYARAVTNASLKLIEDEKYSSCGQEARSLVDAAFVISKAWAR
jgi:hypothetical protein